jgi:hypothetical protein
MTLPRGGCRDHRRGRRLGVWLLDPVLSGNAILAHQAPRGGVCLRWRWSPRRIDWLILRDDLADLRREIAALTVVKRAA